MLKRLFLLTLSLITTACNTPWGQSDPFAPLPGETTETIIGTIFPFESAVSTRASHRVEHNEKLVAYVMSDTIELKPLENQSLSLTGFWRTEKMRQIFAIQSVAPLEEPFLEEGLPQRFTTKQFTFLYPEAWEPTVSPDQTAYFVRSADPYRQVFFTLKVTPYSPEELEIKPNIVLNGLSGIKETTLPQLNKEKTVITLYSGGENLKYVFTVNHPPEDLETQKQFLELIESFVEGEEAVQATIIAQHQAKAEALAEGETDNVKLLPKDESVPEIEDTKAAGLSTEGPRPIKTIPETADEKLSLVKTLPSNQVSSGEFKDLIDNRAFSYVNQWHDFQIQVPYGLWYQNFGSGFGTITEVGFSDQPLDGKSSVKFWFKLISREKPPANISVSQLEGKIIMFKKRDENSVFEISGSQQFSNQMWSIIKHAQ